MAVEQLNTIVVVMLGALLGVLGILFFVIGGFYPLLRMGLSLTNKSPIEMVAQLPEWWSKIREWENEWEAKASVEDFPKSTSVALMTLACLFVLILLTLWLGPVQMEWIPFVLSFAGAEWITIGLYEAAHFLGSHRRPRRR